ncbi:MAG: hypothetical protein ACRDZ4_14975 [Egibacteraceae bacterium]
MSMLNTSALRLMSEQFGIVSRPQLLACGLTEGQVEGLVARGALEKFHCGTYRVPGGGVPVEQAAMAAVIRCRPRARLTGPFVLGLLGVEGFSTADPFEVLVPLGRRVRNVPFTVHTDPLPGQFAAMAGTLPMVTATRALVETARRIQGKRLVVGIDSARWLGLTRLDRLLGCAECYERHSGARLIRGLIASGALDHESEGERMLAVLFADYDPPLEAQVWITPRILADFLWRDVTMILEYDGERFHRRLHDREDDRRRDHELNALGYHVEHVTKADLANPAALRTRILAVRRALLRRQQTSSRASA